MTRRIALLITVIVLTGPWSVSRWTARVFASAKDTRAAGSVIRIVPRTGPPRIETLDGIGCSETICSRMFVRARVEGAEAKIRFDTIAAIEMLGGGDARVRFVDGTSRHVLVAADNRVLYLIDEAGRTKRLDLNGIDSIEFLPRTPWGDPDLQGVWSGVASLLVPFDRDPALGTRSELTEEEIRARLARQLKAGSPDNIEATNFGVEPDLTPATSRQASLVVDPPNGRRPSRTPAAESRRPKRNSFVPGVFDSVADLGLFDRCIAFSTVPGVSPVNGIEIVQSPGYVAIRTEVIHEARVIPLDGRAHVDASITSYAGDSRGRWEGRTLVVETTNVNGATALTGDSAPLTAQLSVVERYTLADRDHLSYEATIDDPGTWTRPWTLAFPRQRDQRHGLYEYACHEGNYGLANILRASRAADTITSK